MGNGYIFLAAVLMTVALFYPSLGDNHAHTGGASGNNNSSFVNGTNNTRKTVAGLQCSRGSSENSTLSMVITVKENDPGFVYAKGPMAGQLITYFCQHLNVTAWRAGYRDRQNEQGCNLTRLDSDGNITSTDSDERTLATTLNFDPTTESAPCGGYVDGSNVTFMVECNRNYPYIASFDIVYQFTCDNNTALIQELSTNTGAGGIPVQNVSRGYTVSANAYVINSGADLTQNDEEITVGSEFSVVPASGIALGTEFVIELKLSANDPQKLFQDGVDVMGIHVGKVMVRNDESSNPTLDGFPGEKELADSNGCSRFVSPGRLGLYKQAFTYVQPTGANETNFYLTSPNTFRSGPIPAEAFITKNNGVRNLIFTLYLSYCFTSRLDGNGVNECFGNVDTTDDDTDGYNNCTGVIGPARKRRQIVPEEGDLPETVSFSITIDTGLPDEVTQTETQGECFEKDTFTILTACLAFLLAVVMMVSVFLACRLQAVNREEKESSLSGFSNKGYY